MATTNPPILVSTNTAYAYGRDIYVGACAYAKAHTGWQLLHGDVFGRGDVPVPSRGNRVCQGLIVMLGTADQVAAVSQCDIPVVNVSDRLDLTPVPKVVADNYAVGRMAAEYFLDRGYRHFAFAPVSFEHHYSNLRCHGFTARLREADPRFEPLLLASGSETDADKCRAAPKPLAVFAGNDQRARKLLAALQGTEMRVPHDVAILGADNDLLVCQTTTPTLSSVDVAAERVGFEAARLLHQMIEGRSAPAVTRLEPRGVITRASSDQLAIDDAEVRQAIELMRTRFHEGLTVEDVQAHVLLSRRSLERRFMKALGLSPATEIRRLRIEHAKRLLTESNLDMPAVAAQCGFHNAKQLSETFAQQVGVPPTHYRRQYARR